MFRLDGVSVPVENEKDIDEASSALLGSDEINSPERYPTSQWRQFWTVLKRTLLFSRRDWVNFYIIPAEMKKIERRLLIKIVFILDSHVSSIVRTYFGWILDWSTLL